MVISSKSMRGFGLGLGCIVGLIENSKPSTLSPRHIQSSNIYISVTESTAERKYNYDEKSHFVIIQHNIINTLALSIILTPLAVQTPPGHYRLLVTLLHQKRLFYIVRIYEYLRDKLVYRYRECKSSLTADYIHDSSSKGSRSW